MRTILFNLIVIGLVGTACNAPHFLQSSRAPEKTLIKQTVLRDLGVQSGANKDLGAYFICVDSDEVQYFTTLFRGYWPRVALTADANCTFKDMQFQNGGVTDKITRRPAVTLIFEKIAITNDKAEVEIVESLGLLGVTTHIYRLVLKDNTWIIESRSIEVVS